jgi:hypothetical protein
LHCGSNSVEAHAFVTDYTRVIDEAFDQQAAEALAAIGGPHIKAFHLADSGIEFSHGDAASGMTAGSGE